MCGCGCECGPASPGPPLCCQQPLPKAEPFFRAEHATNDTRPVCEPYRPPPNCKRTVKSMDPYPIRSPFDTLQHVASLVRGQAVVEIGSRQGDSIDCISQTTRRATTQEMMKNYCRVLQTRSKRTGRFTVVCRKFPKPPVVDADTYIAWLVPFLNPQFLHALHQLQGEGLERASARMLLTFNVYGEQWIMWNRLRPFASSFSRCPYHEPRAAKGDRRGYLVVGVFHPDQMNVALLKKQFHREIFQMGEINGKGMGNKGY